ncbi:MAG: protein phosphatase 2C domain-containing protein [Gammaproteobacteria bacterium]|nr:protein phosphatase 2C domain-containing protein [Gammaproteobacteria bacterium]MDH3431244.1 protein phosphatase 2C domain-containing protein [Gammaproteobacteria bacterium]MDH3435346.1 protein phosphatase 2C domain-containing protein [Gammaproteobacteria bacterium]
MADETWQWVSTGVTNVGNVRKINEDAMLDLPQRGLWVVADGMGGHQAGDVASSSIVQALSEIGEHDRPSKLVDELEDRLIEVNRKLFEMSKSDGQSHVIGSTVAAVVALPAHCLCVWAGDSRVYRLRNFELEQLTVDHSEVEELIAEGSLDRSEAAGYPGENVITRAVGGEEELVLEYQLFPMQHKDRYMICSDGLYKDIETEEIREMMSEGSTADVCQKLLSCALSRRCSDNVSIVTMDFERR